MIIVVVNGLRVSLKIRYQDRPASDLRIERSMGKRLPVS
jgi:hypothetical protein